MQNLLQETISVLDKHGLSKDHVKWCGSSEFGWFHWATFARLANREYNDGYGSQQVCKDLLVVGADWWLERHEYDGVEWWEYKTMPARPKRVRPTTVFASWPSDSLAEVNKTA